MLADGLQRRSWVNRPVPFQLDVTPASVTFWLHGKFIQSFPRSASQTKPRLILELPAADRLPNVVVTPLDPQSLFVPINLAPYANDQLSQSAKPDQASVPFKLLSGKQTLLNLKNAGWIDQKRDPSNYISGYDGGPYVIDDDRSRGA
jgi:hypothetical protein